MPTQSHVSAHLLVSCGRGASRERGRDDGTKRNCIAQTQVHALAAGRRVDVSSVTDKTHPRASGTQLVGAAAKVGEEVLGSGGAGAEARRPDDAVDFVRIRVPSWIAGERGRAVLLDKPLDVLHRRL